VYARLLSTDTVSTLVRTYVTRREDPEIGRNLLAFLKRIGDHAGREMLTLLEKEPVASKRSRILQAIKRLDKSATEAITEKLADPQWYVVRNAVMALAELSDPSLLTRLEPALAHPDGRVQKEAVAAMQKTRSPLRAVPLARALTLLKPAQAEDVLDDLVVLKDAQTIPYLDQFLQKSGNDTKPNILQKAVAALGAIPSADSANALLACAKNQSVALPVRQAALRALAKIDVPEARPMLAEFGRTTSEDALSKLARTLLNA
jgi:HEAT repeat protein